VRFYSELLTDFHKTSVHELKPRLCFINAKLKAASKVQKSYKL